MVHIHNIIEGLDHNHRENLKSSNHFCPLPQKRPQRAILLFSFFLLECDDIASIATLKLLHVPWNHSTHVHDVKKVLSASLGGVVPLSKTYTPYRSGSEWREY